MELTTFEFDILEMLMRSAGRVLSRDALMENFYNRKATPFDRSIDMHISHLRKKLDSGDHAHQDHPRRGLPVLPHAGGRRRGMNSLFAKILLWFWLHAGHHRSGIGLHLRAGPEPERFRPPKRPPPAW